MTVYFLASAVLVGGGYALARAARRGQAARGPWRTPVWRARRHFATEHAYRRYLAGTLLLCLGAVMLAAGLLSRFAF